MRRHGARLGVTLALGSLAALGGCEAVLGLGNDTDLPAGTSEGGSDSSTPNDGPTSQDGPSTKDGGEAGAVQNDAGPDGGGATSDGPLTISPTSVTFGEVTYEQTSGATVVTIKNTSAATTGAVQSTLTGPNASDFAQDSGCTTLAPGATCQIALTFTPADAGARTATLSVSATQAGSASAPLSGTGGYAYSPVATASKWSVFDMETVNTNANGCQSSVFDGRYLYFATSSTVIMQYDTQATFSNAASWVPFDYSVIAAASSVGFFGAVFDGRYVYFVPNNNGGSPSGTVLRYDPQSAFTSAASWSTYNVGSSQPTASGYAGATFDGRFIYLVPNSTSTAVVARYDTQATFTAATSWSTFDVSTVNPKATGFYGAEFDGRYVYLNPSSDTVVPRFDTQAAFTSASSWTTFDPTTVNANAKAFIGGGFDGRYVYFVPYSSAQGTVARFDSTAAFTTAGSWSTFDVGTAGGDAGTTGFAGSVFDGRYLYLVPNFDLNGYHGVVAAYDTSAAFGTTASWSLYDVGALNPNAKGFWSGAFDGRYLYLVPRDNGEYDGVVARFDAKQPPGVPAAFHGSFF